MAMAMVARITPLGRWPLPPSRGGPEGSPMEFTISWRNVSAKENSTRSAWLDDLQRASNASLNSSRAKS